MKATGIVRRIDDLGRVVIPKEIRRTMRIREGDPLEIYTDRDGEVIFKKYSPIGELSQFATQYAETLHKTCGLSVIICDRDAVIACAGVPAVDGGQHFVSCAMPIITEGDITGCVASIVTPENQNLQPGLEAKLIQTAAGFLGRQLEN